ncbi:MAG: methionyl-tRNA formyltransferase, partial [Coriobacteriales bacterium]
TRHELVAVYSRPDAASHRGRALHPAPAKVEATRQHVPVRTPDDFSDPATIDELASFEPDVIITAAFGVILPQAVLDLPRYACINVHASLLPRWRGAAPIQRAILADDETTGISVMRMTSDLDAGDVCYAAELDILDRNTEDLTAALARLAVRALPDVLDQIERGTVQWTPQDSAQATFAPKVDKSEVMLTPDATAHDNQLRVRAATSSNLAKAFVCGRSISVLKAHVIDEDVPAGAVSIKDRRVALGCVFGTLSLDEVKPDGKNAMSSKAWLLGLRNAELEWRAL